MCDGELSWCNTSQKHAELTVWPARTNSLYTTSLMSKKMMSMLLTLPRTSLALLGLGEFGFSVYCSCFFPERLFNHCQGLRHTSSEICTKSDVHSLSESQWNHRRPDTRLQIKEAKISTSTQLREILYTDSQDTLLVLSLTVVHRLLPAVQLGQPVLEIMDITSCIPQPCSALNLYCHSIFERLYL
jgi:hypothetical protein